MPIDKTVLHKLQTNDLQITSLNFGYQNLQIADIKELLDALKNNTYVTALDLTGNQLTNETVIYLAEHCKIPTLTLAGNQLTEEAAVALVKNNFITALGLCENKIGDEGANTLGYSTKLRHLNLRNNQISAKGLEAFETNTILESLVVSDNPIEDAGVVHLSRNQHLTHIEMSQCQITNTGAITIATHPTLTSIMLCNNYINDIGAKAIAEHPKLKLAKLNYNQIGDFGAKCLSCSTSISSLHLAGNRINHMGIKALANSSQAYDILDLSYNEVDDDSALEFQANNSIRYLDLSYNCIGPKGVEGLKNNQKLETLIISNNSLGDKGAQLLAQSKSIRYLNVAGNNIGPIGGKALSEALMLDTLIISSNPLGDEGGVPLAESNLRHLYMSYTQTGDATAFALAKTKNLLILNVNYNQITEKGREALTHNLNIKSLSISLEQPPEFTEENLSLIFLLAQDFFCIRGIDGSIQFFNPAFSRTLGYPSDELLGLPYTSLLHPHDRNVKEIIAKTKFPTHNYEARYRCKDGSYKRIRWNERILNNRIYAVGTDITEQKQLDSIRMLREKMIAITAKQHAEEQTKFTSRICHELRTPLGGIIGNIELSNSKISQMEPVINSLEPFNDTRKLQLQSNLTELSEYLHNIQICADFQTNILDSNLDLTAIIEDKIKLRNEPFDIKLILNEIMQIVKFKAEAKKLLITTSIPDEKILVKGDAVRIKQIFLNLLTNAIKFTPQGKIDIKLDISQQTADYVQITYTVHDTGIGIAPEERQNIFKRFSQANSNIGSEFHGSGLGLNIAKGLSQLMQGDITFESEKGVGSTFCCTLRCQNLTTEERHVFETKQITPYLAFTILPPPMKKYRVLLAEDNLVNQMAIKKHLLDAGYECLIANNGSEAIEQYQKNQPIDLILMDIQMPYKNGIEATKIIRELEAKIAQGKAQKIPIIALSGNALSNEQQEALDAGMNDFIAKPVKKDVLLTRMAHHLSSLQPTPEIATRAKTNIII